MPESDPAGHMVRLARYDRTRKIYFYHKKAVKPFFIYFKVGRGAVVTNREDLNWRRFHEQVVMVK
jgi:hypothetical protein